MGDLSELEQEIAAVLTSPDVEGISDVVLALIEEVARLRTEVKRLKAVSDALVTLGPIA